MLRSKSSRSFHRRVRPSLQRSVGASVPPSGLLRFMRSGCPALPAKPSALRRRAGSSPLLQRLAAADCPRRDRLGARTRSRVRTCAGVAPSLEDHDPKSLTLSGHEEFVRERTRVIDESYGPGFRYWAPFSLLGHTCAYPHPGPYAAIFVANREAAKHPAETALQRVRVCRMAGVTAICAPPAHTRSSSLLAS
jgi:hypothetical protein